MKNQLNRSAHIGKNPYEKEAYKNFLNTKFKLDKTADDPADITKTDSSAVDLREDDADERVAPIDIKRKSRWLRIKDFFSNNWVVSFVTGIIILILGTLFTGYINIVQSQAADDQKMLNLNNTVNDISTENEKTNESLNTLINQFDVFQGGVEKDIGYIKQKIGLGN